MELSSTVVLSKRDTVALFAIVIASSLIVVSGFVGSAFAAKKKVNREDDVPTISLGKYSLKSPSVNADDLSGDTGDDSDISAKNLNLKSLSKCEAAAAEDGDLTLVEQRECYRLACNDYD